MKAIITRYVPATNTKPSRVIAEAEGGNRHVMTFASYYGDDARGSGPYRKAAEELCMKMDWDGKLIGGGTKDGYVFVFAESQD